MVTFVWQRQFLFSLNHHLSVYVWYFRSLFCGTARSRHQIGANGHPCLSPSLWQTEGGRWGPMPLITSRRFDIWVTAWQTVNRSASLCISFFFLCLCFSFSGLLLWCVFFCLSSYPCISDMSTDPCGIHFHKCHSFSKFLLWLSFTVHLFSPAKPGSKVIHSSQSLNMIHCNMIVSHSIS